MHQLPSRGSALSIDQPWQRYTYIIIDHLLITPSPSSPASQRVLPAAAHAATLVVTCLAGSLAAAAAATA